MLAIAGQKVEPNWLKKLLEPVDNPETIWEKLFKKFLELRKVVSEISRTQR